MAAEHEVEKLKTDLANWQDKLREAETESNKLEAQVEVLSVQLAGTRSDVDIYRKLTEGLEGLLAKLAPAGSIPVTVVHTVTGAASTRMIGGEDGTKNGHPRGADAILRVIRERAGEWQQVDIINTVVGRGWIDPNAKQPKEAVRVAIKRLVDRGQLERLRPGVLRLPAAQQTSFSNEEEVPSV